MNTYADDIVVTERPPSRTYRFGPGSLEMIDATTWTRNGIGRIRMRGWYDVFCGNGSMHREWVDQNAWTDQYVDMSLDQVAAELIGYALDDWFDPCEELTDADDA